MENLWRKWYHGPNRMFHAFKRSTTNTHQSVKEDLLPQILNMRPDFRFACQICQNHQKSGDSQLSYQWKNHILITRFGPAKKMPTTHLTYSKGWTCSGLRLKATLNSKGAKAKGIRIRDYPRCAKCQQSDQPSVSHLLWTSPVTFENAAHMFPKFVATIQPVFMIRPELEQPGVSYATHGKKRDTLALNSPEQAESLKRFLCRNTDYAKTCGQKT